VKWKLLLRRITKEGIVMGFGAWIIWKQVYATTQNGYLALIGFACMFPAARSAIVTILSQPGSSSSSSQVPQEPSSRSLPREGSDKLVKERILKLKNGTYNVLKFVAMVVLPAAATAYFALAGIWHLPHTEQIIGTISAVDTFLGAILHVSTKSYSPPSNGKLVIDKSDPTKDTYQLDVTTPLDELDKLETILLKVEPGSSIEMKTTKP
jgi:hypothetical protein